MTEWIRACDSGALLPGETTVIWIGDTPVLLVNFDGDYHALEDRCSHEDFELSSGSFDGERGSVECALHGARFDVRDGRALCPPACTPVPCHPVKIEDGVVWVGTEPV